MQDIEEIDAQAPQLIIWAIPLMIFFTVLEYFVAKREHKNDIYDNTELRGSVLVGLGNLLSNSGNKTYTLRCCSLLLQSGSLAAGVSLVALYPVLYYPGLLQLLGASYFSPTAILVGNSCASSQRQSLQPGRFVSPFMDPAV
jgi:hypothetical protein